MSISIDEAIEVLEGHQKVLQPAPSQKKLDALLLGIQALQRIRLLREVGNNLSVQQLLPGERWEK